MTEPASAVAVGVRWDPRWDPATVIARARRFEELGFAELWMIEDCFSAGGLTTATAALAATERIRVGIGVLPTPVRNAAIVAMECAAVARMFPGRFLPGFGHGVDSWMRQVDARPRHRIALLEETVSAVRALLAGERLNVEGEFVKLRDVELEHLPEAPPPVLIGTTGPRGLDVAARVSDGVIMPEVATPAAIEWVRSILDAGRSPAGRIVSYAYLSIADDTAAGRDAARPLVERWLRSGDFPDLAERAGLTRDGEGSFEEETFASIAVAGDAADCLRTVAGLADAGADSVVLLPGGEDPDRQLERFAVECLPAIAPPSR